MGIFYMMCIGTNGDMIHDLLGTKMDMMRDVPRYKMGM
jgi:hypothetical protein